MIKGIGSDIIEVNRVKAAIHKNERFLIRFFGEKELEGITSSKKPEERAAGRFAAKEAVVKALGTGFSGFKWKDIQIINDSRGKPEVVFFGKALDYMRKNGIGEIKITISHSREFAVAFAVAIGIH